MVVLELNLAVSNLKLDEIVAKRVLSMITSEDSFSHLKLFIVKELLGKARYGVFVELGAD